MICAIGAYTVNNSMHDIWFMLGFGVIGYVFKKLNYPLAPLVLALVLGNNAENAFRQSMLMSQGSLGILWSNGLVGGITTLALVMLFWPLIAKRLTPCGPRARTSSPSSSRWTDKRGQSKKRRLGSEQIIDASVRG